MEKEKSVIDSILTVSDALKATGRPQTPAFNEVPEDLREFFKSIYEGVVVVEALNEGEKVDYDNTKERKWAPWMEKSPSGFVFYYSYYRSTTANAGCGVSPLPQKRRVGRPFWQAVP